MSSETIFLKKLFFEEWESIQSEELKERLTPLRSRYTKIFNIASSVKFALIFGIGGLTFSNTILKHKNKLKVSIFPILASFVVVNYSVRCGTAYACERVHSDIFETILFPKVSDDYLNDGDEDEGSEEVEQTPPEYLVEFEEVFHRINKESYHYHQEEVNY